MYTYEYPRPMVAVDLLVIHRCGINTYIILVQRAKEPFRDFWALPGGFLNDDETAVEGAVRELKEETGYRFSDLSELPKLIGVYDKPDRDPRGRVISLAYAIEVKEMLPVKGMDDARRAGWHDINTNPLAFDHEKIIKDYKHQKNNEIKSTNGY